MNKKIDDHKKLVLSQLVLHPALKRAARNAKLNPTTIFRWLKESIADPEKHRLTWLGHDQPFHLHVNAARKLNIVAIEANARDLAVNGHESPRFFNGAPVWRRDAKIAADALAMTDDEWTAEYGQRPRSDTFHRDPETGGLVQEMDVSPPNPAVLVKLLTSLAPEVYGEKSEVAVTHQGHVWIEGGTQQTPALSPPPTDFNSTFGLTQRPEEAQRPTNTLAIPRPCKDSEEFDRRFRRKLLREVVLFRDTEGKLLAPFPDDVVVLGSPQHRAFQDAGIEVNAVHPTILLDEGFENPWLKELAPNHKRKLKPVAPEDVGQIMGQEMRETSNVLAGETEPPGKASTRYDSENLGPGKPPPGGRRIAL